MNTTRINYGADAIEQCASLRFERFERIVFLTGAGLSVESGIPTYSGPGSTGMAYKFEDAACQRAFDEDPEKAWDVLDKRRAAAAGCAPNIGHTVIADVQRRQPSTVIITQNFDGLHDRAGSTNVIELHGSLWRMRCEREGILVTNTDVPIQSRKCACGAYWRPELPWFKRPLGEERIRGALEALGACDLLVSVGTTGMVHPAPDFPPIATNAGATTVEINLEDTPATGLYQYALRGKASQWLELLWQ